MLWHTNGKKPEMSLKSWVHNEGTSSWVHSSNKLGILDVLKCELGLIIPMLVISVLSEESNSVLGIIWISSWHVQVIHEVNKLSLSLWSIQSTGFLLQVLLQDHLKQVSISVEVEVDDLVLVKVRFGADVVKKTLDDLSLTATGLSHQDWRVVDVDKLVHQVRG